MSKGRAYVRILNADGVEKYRYLQTDAIQKLESFEEIKHHFEYDDEYDDFYSPIDSKFGKFKIDVQKEIAEGIEWARTTYRLDSLPLTITRGPTRKEAIGLYDSLDRSITFRPSTSLEESFVTAVHEMTHFYNHVKHVDVDEIFTQAIRNLGFKKGTRKAIDLQHMTVGVYNRTNDWNTPEELVAYSLEREATGRHNDLSAEIARIWLERIDE